jgi:hypothetical protein
MPALVFGSDEVTRCEVFGGIVDDMGAPGEPRALEPHPDIRADAQVPHPVRVVTTTGQHVDP